MKAPIGFVALDFADDGTPKVWSRTVIGDVDAGTDVVRGLRANGHRAALGAVVPVPGPAGDPDGDLGHDQCLEQHADETGDEQ